MHLLGLLVLTTSEKHLSGQVRLCHVTTIPEISVATWRGRPSRVCTCGVSEVGREVWGVGPAPWTSGRSASTPPLLHQPKKALGRLRVPQGGAGDLWSQRPPSGDTVLHQVFGLVSPRHAQQSQAGAVLLRDLTSQQPRWLEAKQRPRETTAELQQL